MSIVTYKLEKGRKLTPEQLKELEIMDKSPITPDSEFPDSLDGMKAMSIGDFKRYLGSKRKRVEAITAEKESGSDE